jgi:hypothetical protein
MKLKPWHLLALSGFVWACSRREDRPPLTGAGDETPNPDEPLEPERPPEFFVHDRDLIAVALKAAERIEAASGIKIAINKFGTARTASPIFGSDFLCANGSDGLATPYGIAMARGCDANPEQVMVHELIHKLGVGHLVLPQRGIMNTKADSPLLTISADDLTALCAVRACSRFQPES